MKKAIVYLTLAMVTLSLILVPGVSSQQSEVEVLKYSWYVDSIGYLVVVGEVQNNSPNTVDSVFLAGQVTSSDGTQTNSGIQAWVRNLIPQQRAPFYMEFFSETSGDGTWNMDITNVDITVLEAPVIDKYQYPDLKVLTSSASIGSDRSDQGDFGVFWVTGTIQNTGSQTAKNLTVVGTFYNSTGTVVAVGYTRTLTPTNLGASETATFKLGAFDLNQSAVPTDKKIASYSVLIQVLEPILDGKAPDLTPTQTPSPITGQTTSPTSPLTPDGSNSTSSPLMPYTVYAVVIAIAIIAIATTFIFIRKRSMSSQKKLRKTKK